MSSTRPATGAAFLLTQLGTHAAQRFAERTAEQGLTPPQSGILRLLRTNAGMSQQELANFLGMMPSRVVALIDEMEASGLVERTRHGTDRRRNVLVLTAQGEDALRAVMRVARAHEDELTAALTADERATLVELLTRVADQQGLTPGVHPGYRTLRPNASR